MHMFLPAVFASWALIAAAQNSSNPVILVGSTTDAPGGIFQFIPPSINATNGTTITFRFTGAPGNHSVTQSKFSDPCNPLPGGFDSGWVFIPENNVSVTPEWNLTITNTSTPLWFFCKQLIPGPHCAAGMVGAINAPATGNLTFAAYQQAAAKFQGNSGQGEGSLVGPAASASAPPGPITGGAQYTTGAPATSGASGAPPAPSGGSGSGGTGGASRIGVSLLLNVSTLLLVIGTLIGLAF